MSKKKQCEPGMNFQNEVQIYSEKHGVNSGANFLNYYEEFVTCLEATCYAELFMNRDHIKEFTCHLRLYNRAQSAANVHICYNIDYTKVGSKELINKNDDEMVLENSLSIQQSWGRKQVDKRIILHRITFCRSKCEKPVRELSSLVSDIGLEITSAHHFSIDTCCLGIFTVAKVEFKDLIDLKDKIELAISHKEKLYIPYVFSSDKYGTTSLSSDVFVQSINIRFLSFSNEEETISTFKFLTTKNHYSFLRPHFLLNRKGKTLMICDRVKYLEEWLQEQIMVTSKEKWWTHIKSKFKTIFGGVIKALCGLYDEKKLPHNLTGHLIVLPSDIGTVLPNEKGSPSSANDIINCVQQLFKMMDDFIGFRFTKSASYYHKDALFGVSAELQNYLTSLLVIRACNIRGLKVLIDDPFFWTRRHRIDLILRVDSWRKSNSRLSFLIDKYFSYRDWDTFIQMGPMYEVYHFDSKPYNYGRNLIRYCRNAFMHYNDKLDPQNSVDDYKILDDIECTFPLFFSRLKKAVVQCYFQLDLKFEREER